MHLQQTLCGGALPLEDEPSIKSRYGFTGERLLTNTIYLCAHPTKSASGEKTTNYVHASLHLFLFFVITDKFEFRSGVSARAVLLYGDRLLWLQFKFKSTFFFFFLEVNLCPDGPVLAP